MSDLGRLREVAEAAPEQAETDAEVIGVWLRSRYHLTIRPDVLLALLDGLEAAEAKVCRVEALADEWEPNGEVQIDLLRAALATPPTPTPTERESAEEQA
ncbi:MAG: hypothetical protein ACXVXP_00180 [Mycobacteriaceae bacterium]